MSEQLFIETGRSRLQYRIMGTGSQWLCCFHGYGEDSTHFQLFEKVLGKTHTLLAIDMPFHGGSEWKDDLLFEPAELMRCIDAITGQAHKIQLFGYSMGGRISLSLLEMFPNRISRVVLVAPDGLHKNKWQRFATQTIIGNRLFKFTMRYPGWMLGLMELGGWTGLFNKSIIKFVRHRLDDADERSILYKRWTTLRKFKPEHDVLKPLLVLHHIPVHILFGSYDRVILPKHGYRFQQYVNEWVHVKEIKAGHHLLQEKYLHEIHSMF